MKKIIVAFSVLTFLFVFSGAGVSVKADDNSIQTTKYVADKDPKVDGTKKAAKSCCSGEATKTAKASCDDKAAAACKDKAAASCDGKAVNTSAKGDCDKPCDKTSSAQKSECSGNKTTTAQADVSKEAK